MIKRTYSATGTGSFFYPQKSQITAINKRLPMRLTIKAIIRWEQLNKKPFSQINYNSEDEITSLFYACTLSDGIQKSLGEFRKEIKATEIQAMFSDFSRQITITSQFQEVSKKDSQESEDSNPAWIKDTVAMLVINGLDVYYAMNDMELCDLPLFLQGYDQKRKNELEYSRLWTYLQVQPHLSKKIEIKDLCPFAWELEEETIYGSKLEKGKNEFQAFLKTGLKI